jgi:hypothetical protein
MAEDNWQAARLIPTSGINGQDEAERRATSALLAVMGAVREFGTAIARPLGAPGGQLSTYIEVPFVLGERTVIPDGVLQATRAGKAWTALVEVKTGHADLERDQVEAYLDVAREQGFDAVVTFSNQIAPAPGVHPVDVDRRKLKKVALHHLSWSEVLTLAVQHRVHTGVSDPDQAWILGELIRYLEHPRSGALDFSDMGGSWVTVRESITAGTLRPGDKGLAETLSRWDQLLRYAALRLGRELGADVQVVLTRKEVADPNLRAAALAKDIVERGVLTGSLRIPDAIAPIDVTADLRAGRVIVSVDVDAPREGRAATRVNWLLRQLRDAPDALRIDAWTVGARTSTSELLRVVRDDPTRLIESTHKELRTFRVAASSPMGTKRSAGRGGFIDSVLAAVDGFYAAVVEQLRPWAPKAPKLPKSGRTAAEEAGIDITPPPGDVIEDLDLELPEPGDESPDDDVIASVIETTETLAQPPASEPGAVVEDDDDLVSWSGAEDRLEHERAAEMDVRAPDAEDERRPTSWPALIRSGRAGTSPSGSGA